MKQRLLLVVLILFSISNNAQAQGGPPPGYFPVYFCDDEEFDGRMTLDLTYLEAASVLSIDTSDYNFEYTYSQNFSSQVFPLEDPSNYTNSVNGEIIYLRATHKTNGTYFYNTYEVNVINPFRNDNPSPLIACDIDNNGLRVFDLTTKEEEILSGLNKYAFDIEFFETNEDAVNNTNAVDKNAYTNRENFQIVYVRISAKNQFENPYGCYEIVELELRVENDCSDIAVYLLPQNAPRPGFNYVNYLVVKNEGQKNVSGDVEFFNDSSVSYGGIQGIDSGNSKTNTATGCVLHFNSLEPGESEKVKIFMYVPASTRLGTRVINRASYSENDANLI